MVIIEEKPKHRAKSANLEHKLQASMVKWFASEYPDKRGRLWCNFTTTKSQAEGGIMLSLGLVKSLSDLMWMDKIFTGMEVKHEGTSHKVQHLIDQATWLITVPDSGWFVDSLEMFQGIIQDAGVGVDPRKVLAYCKNIKTGSITWKNELFT